MKHVSFYLCLLFLCHATPILAAPITYFSDPVHPSVHRDYQGHPLARLKNLAENEHDARAQFMMGDMLAKGKGGFAKDIDKAQHFFQASAKGGNPHAFIRLAAMAEKQDNILEAYQWYYLGSQYFPKGDNRIYLIRKKNMIYRDFEITNTELRLIKKNIRIWHNTDFQYPALPPLESLAELITLRAQKHAAAQEIIELDLQSQDQQQAVSEKDTPPSGVATDTNKQHRKEERELEND